MTKIVIVGAGGHAREVLEVIMDCRSQGQSIEAIGFIDENQELHGKVLDGLSVLGGLQWFGGKNRNEANVVCAIGTPESQKKLACRIQCLGIRFANVISPRSYISPKAKLGRGIVVFPNVIVNTGAVIGAHVTLNVGASISHDTVVGNFCNINPGVHLAGNVSIGEGCYIGMGTNVIQNISIGSWSVLGAGTAAIHHIPDNVTAVGVPARTIKTNGDC